MTPTKRTIELFTAGCTVCEGAITLVKSLACPSCDVQILNVHDDSTAAAKAKKYSLQRLPAVVVNGVLAECCQGGINEATLRALGVGAP